MTGRSGRAGPAGRLVQAVTVPTGPAVLALLPDLARALAGDGPALLPLGAADPRAAEIARALGAGEPLGPGEDGGSPVRAPTGAARGTAVPSGDPQHDLRRTDPTALVMPTSGSTGNPKGVLLPAGALTASAAATEARLGGPGTWLLALPAEHIAGMQVLLRAAAAGTEPVVLDVAEPFTAQRFAAAASTMPGPRRYVSLVPTQLQRVLADAEARSAAAELFDAVLVGGAATPAALLAAAREAGIPVVTTYGMTETCGGCVYDGRPLDGVTVTVEVSGALVLTGPVVARGYRGRPGDPAFATPGSFVTADTGHIAAGGSLQVAGRLDDVIVTGGVNVAPVAVEAALLALPGIAGAVVVGLPDAQWGQVVTALIVSDGPEAAAAAGSARARWDLPGIRAALAHLPASHRPRRLQLVTALPLLRSGKPDRAAAQRLAAGG